MKIWQALAEGKVIKGSETWGKSLGAFVNIVVLAEDADEIEELAAYWLKGEELELIGLEDVMLVSDDGQLVSEDSSDEILELAKLVSEEYPVQYDEFHSYLAYDA